MKDREGDLSQLDIQHCETLSHFQLVAIKQWLLLSLLVSVKFIEKNRNGKFFSHIKL